VTIARWERLIGRQAPGGTSVDESGNLRPNPRFVEWLMVLNDGWVTSSDLELSNADQLSALGNGVVPRQAILAVERLLAVARGDVGRFGPNRDAR
jgi:DNA (cytosine-5)-methyltransferase 1